MNASIRRTLSRLASDLDEFHVFSDLAQQREERISAWSIGEHLDHMMKVDRSIFERLESPLDKPLPPLSTVGHVVLWTGWIPRGKGKAPDFVRPEVLPAERLRAAIVETREVLARAAGSPERLADPRRIAKHHIFGGMSAAQWLRFSVVHHHHHVKIIRDVLRADPA